MFKPWKLVVITAVLLAVAGTAAAESPTLALDSWLNLAVELWNSLVSSVFGSEDVGGTIQTATSCEGGGSEIGGVIAPDG